MGYGGVAVDEELSYLQQMVESITESLVIRLDERGNVCSWHPGASRLTQYEAAEIMGRPISLLHPEEDVQAGRLQAELHAAAEAQRLDTEGWLVRRDGGRIWVAIGVTPMHDSHGAPTGFVITMRDLADRDLRIAARAMERMLDAITDFEVIRLDPDGTVRSWSPGAQRLKQYTEQEVLGHNVSMFYAEVAVRAGMAEREMAKALRETRFETEGWRIRKDGSRFWANVVMSPIWDDDGAHVGFVKVARDLSERREQEQLVQRQRDEILELSTPVIQVWDKVLVLPVIGTLDSLRASRLTESLLERISSDQAEVVILDISGVPAIDTDVAQHLLKTVEAARLMGAVSVLSGVRPETAQAIVHLGIELGTLRSRNSLRDALQLALRLVGGFERFVERERETVDA
jgi:PAS domain S-box-containing protein